MVISSIFIEDNLIANDLANIALTNREVGKKKKNEIFIQLLHEN